MKKLLQLLVFILAMGNSFAEIPSMPDAKYTISGYIKDTKNGEVLIGVTVFVKELKIGTVTNSYGYYSLNLQEGKYQIDYSYIGYNTITRPFLVNRNIQMNIELEESSEELSEVIVKADRPQDNVTKAEMSVIKMDIKQIQKVPALMGEIDVIKVIQLLPGVQSTSEGGSGFSVRGGGADQNLILLDEAVVYNASHLMGFFSVFNNDAIKEVKLYKGDIPASFGGRLSSVLDVRMKEGNSKKFSGTGGIGTISSRLTLEGPILQDRTSFIASGRRTYADVFLPLAKNKDLRDNTLYFYDLNMKINHEIDNNNKLFLSGYMGRDIFKNNFANMAFGNKTLTARWNHLFSQKLFSNVTLVASQYDYELGSPEGQANSFNWQSALNDYSGKIDFTYFINPQNTLKFGYTSTYHEFTPGVIEGMGSNSIINKFVIPSKHALEHALYVSDQQQIGEKLTLKYGLRYTLFQNIGKGIEYGIKNFEIVDSSEYESMAIYKNQGAWEPRAGINYMLNSKSSIKASYARTYQFVHLASNSTGGMPLDIWFPSSPYVKPQKSDQYAIGYFRNFFDDSYEASVELYYKNMYDLIDFKDHPILLMNKQLEKELRFGEGEAYGAEFLIRKNTGKLTGWISYTYSRSYRMIKEINFGRKYNSPFDKPHNISVVGNYDFNKRISLSATWVYSTGSPITFPVGRYYGPGAILPLYSNRNEYRMPDYHRLDVAFVYKMKQRKYYQSELNISVYNAYARKNAWSIYFEADEENPNKLNGKMIYLFSFIPSITYNINF